MTADKSSPSPSPADQMRLSATILALAIFVPSIYLGSSQIGLYQEPSLIAAVMITSGLACSAAAGYAWWLSFANGYEENSLVAAGLLSSSLLVMAHGLLTPNALYDMNSGVAVAGQLSSLAYLPAFVYLVVSRGQITRGQNWRFISSASVGLGLLVSIWLLIAPDALTPMKLKTTSTLIIIVIAIVVGLLTAAHFVDLAQKFRQGRSFGIGVGLIFTASGPVFFYFGGPYTAAYWWTHGMCIAGTGIAAWMIWRRTRETEIIADVFASMITEKPMQTLEVYNSPRIMQMLRALDDPNDPRVKQALQSSRLLAEVSQERGLDRNVVLPTLKTMIESLESSPT
ncbi:MAG: hypothetical protein HN811_03640 [Phycisphaerae bacterium]|nr:hypothetical protein [Phycisphaerae bacterium]